MHDLGVADQLHGHEVGRTPDVVVLDRIEIALDGGDDDVIQRLDIRQRGSDALRVGQVDRDPANVAADRRRYGLRTSRVPPGQGHGPAAIGVVLHDLTANAGRATNDQEPLRLSHERSSLRARRWFSTSPCRYLRGSEA